MNEMAKTDPFEKYSEAYDDWFARNPEAYQAELAAIRQLLPSPLGRGLEVGVGTGKFAVPLGIKLGVEPAAQMAVKAEHLGIKVVPGVAEQLPFGDAEFDCVLMVTTICFVDDIVASFREARRVLKPGGCIIVGFVDKETELGRQYLAKREKSKFYKAATFFSTREVLDHLVEAGFGKVEIRQTLLLGEDLTVVREGYGEGAFIAIKSLKLDTL
jgi:ubiquinone/menaquinone biosynthesis C-methylase UbiE